MKPCRRALLALVLMGLALAHRASADITKYIDPAIGVDDTVTHGGTAAAPWRTIGFANRVLRQPNTTNGHIIVYLADYEPGYDSLPNPDNLPANGKRWFFIGNPTNPAACVVVPRGSLYRAYVTIRGVKFSSSLTVDSTGADSKGAGQAYADSITQCIMPSFADAGSKYCRFVDLTITGSSQKFGGSSLTFDKVTVGNIYSDIAAHSLGQNTGINYSLKFDHLDSCSFRRLKTTIRVDAQGAQQGAVSLFMVRNSTFNQCRFDIYKNATDYRYTWKMRNWSYGNHFIADTIMQLGPAEGGIYLMELGGTNQNQVADTKSSNSPAYWDSCLFYNKNGYIGPNYNYSDFHFNRCTFVAFTAPAFSNHDGQMGDSVEFNHCTFATPAGQNTIDWGGESGKWQSDLKLVFKNNIVAQFPWNGSTGTVLGTCTAQTRDRNNSIYAENGNGARMDSLRGNVYYNMDYGTTLGDRTWWINSGCYAVGAAAVGASSPLTALQAGKDKVSKHANPLFNANPDTVVRGLPGWDATLSSASPARGYADGGADAGAVAFAAQPQWVWVPSDPDTTTVTDTSFAASYTDTFTIKNSGTSNLSATFTLLMASAGANITLDTTSVLIAGGRARTYTATYYTPGFSGPAGIYVDYMIFATNDPARPTIYRPFVRTRGTYSIE